MSRRHRVSGRQLGRSTPQRKALFKGLLNSLILKEEIKTTAPKAKAIKGLADKLITRAKLGTLHARRLLYAFLGNQKAVNKLVDEIAPRLKARPSGFTSLTRLLPRRGDNTPLVKLSLLDRQPVTPPPAISKETPKKTK